MKKHKSQKQNIFQAEDYYMLRTPFQSLDFFKNLADKQPSDYLKLIIENKELREAISIASPSFNSMVNEHADNIIVNQDIKKIRNLISSLVRYSIRISSRPTPFGMFSGISLGEFSGEELNPITQISTFKKIVRPDIEWLLGIIRNIEQNELILKKLKVRKSNALHKVGDRINVKVMSLFGQSKTNEEREISVSFTKPLKKILELTKENILVQDLLEELSKEFKDVDHSLLGNYIKELIKQEILLTELRPSLISDSLMSELIEILNSIYPSLHDKLDEKKMMDDVIKINSFIEDFNLSSEKQTEEKYAELIYLMKNLYETSNYLKLDSHANVKNNRLPKKIKNEIADIAECLWKWNRHTKSSILEEYKEKFIEAYGIFHEVPLLDVISEEKGIGFPQFETNSEQKKQFKKMMESQDPSRYILLTNLIQSTIKEGKVEINLDDDILEKLTNLPYEGEIPEGLDIYAEILKDVKNDTYSIVLNPNAGVQGVGRSFGRFLHTNESIKKSFLNSNTKVRKQNKEVEYVELTYFPSNGKSGNVMQTIVPTKYKLDLSTINNSNNISLEDFILISDGNHIYIKSKALNKEIRFITSHMFNHHNSPKLCRLLLEITNSHYASWNVFNWGLLQFNEYLPRIKRHNTIIYPQTWRFYYDKSNKINTNNSIHIASSIDKWIKLWKIPRYVYLTFSDLRMLLDLENELHRKELINEVNKKYQFELQEFTGSFEDRIVESQHGKHTMEIVIPVLRNEEILVQKEKIYDLTENTHYSSNDIKRIIFPGDECLFVKLYGSYTEQQSFIATQLLEFIESLNVEQLIHKWFYIRYYDTAPHIRLRLFGNKDFLNSVVLSKLNQFIKENIQSGKLQTYSLHPYEREIERYGGELLIEKAEELFHLDSITSANLLNYIQQNEIDSALKEKVFVGIISTIKMLYSFNLKDNDIISMILPKEASKAFMKEFRQHKDFLIKTINPHNDWSALRSLAGGQELLDLLNIREEIINSISNDMKFYQTKNLLSHQQIKIFIDSIIHMHCNRFLDNNEMEDRLRALIQLTLQSRQYTSKTLVTLK